MNSQYDKHFFQELRKGSRSSAKAIVPYVLDAVRPSSVVDVGCGVGTWLSVFAEHEITDMLGMDGDYVDVSMLEIPENQFRPVDLKNSFAIERTFELAMSLEVVEHLSAESAAGFVAGLTELSPVILFSAAIPYQGGVHHVNEQWPEYWVELFANRDYIAVDYLRRTIWNDKNIEWWYAQNILFFVKKDSIGNYPLLAREQKGCPPLPRSLVHPSKYIDVVWEGMFWRSVAELYQAIGTGERFILVDDGQFIDMLGGSSGAIPFLEKDAHWWGRPANSIAAIDELERQHYLGSRFIVFLWTAFWWLEDYPGLRDRVVDFSRILQNERMIVFEMPS